jgi:hypothetical protein
MVDFQVPHPSTFRKSYFSSLMMRLRSVFQPLLIGVAASQVLYFYSGHSGFHCLVCPGAALRSWLAFPS